MGIIQGEFLRKDADGDAQPQNGATAKLWLDNAAFQAAVVTYPPQKGTALPTAVSPAATVTTGTAHGGEGAYRFTGVTDGRYFISIEYSTDDIVWQYADSPPAPDASGDWIVEGTAEIGTQGVTAGQVDLWSPTALKGKFRFKAADSAGDTATTVTHASQAAARTYTIPDAGAAASFVMTQGAQTIAGTKIFSGAVDAAALSLASVAVSATAAELNTLDGITATTAELNILDGVTATAANLNTLAGVVTGSKTWDPGTLNADTAVSTTITVTGAAVGDYVIVTHYYNDGDINDLIINGYVTTTNTVTLRLYNRTTIARTLSSTTWRVLVIKQ